MCANTLMLRSQIDTGVYFVYRPCAWDRARERLLIWLQWPGLKVSLCICFIREPDTREHHRVCLCGGGVLMLKVTDWIKGELRQNWLVRIYGNKKARKDISS